MSFNYSFVDPEMVLPENHFGIYVISKQTLLIIKVNSTDEILCIKDPRYAIHFYSGRGPQIEQSELAYRSNNSQMKTEYQSRPSRTESGATARWLQTYDATC
ncbi:hypothetical protein C2G38_2209196 [Gigaspora rosea]|uniref:Uncharacterized protein n=1 Tax=Gigaspora rosea TaxID=44941 RepID=A0A397UJN7_9GLOM|nr:hypothetical protein C2G38_2209196 [Gigaspora rosea]